MKSAELTTRGGQVRGARTGCRRNCRPELDCLGSSDLPTSIRPPPAAVQLLVCEQKSHQAHLQFVL
jgi:hypothetical protein